jgi:hypothetical protein
MQERPEPPDEPFDWDSLVEEFEALAVSRFGKRAEKITELLASADHSLAEIQAALNQINHLTIAFVDPVAIDDLVYEMEQRLAVQAGIDPPPRRGYVPRGIYATDAEEYI